MWCTSSQSILIPTGESCQTCKGFTTLSTNPLICLWSMKKLKKQSTQQTLQQKEHCLWLFSIQYITGSFKNIIMSSSCTIYYCLQIYHLIYFLKFALADNLLMEDLFIFVFFGDDCTIMHMCYCALCFILWVWWLVGIHPSLQSLVGLWQQRVVKNVVHCMFSNITINGSKFDDKDFVWIFLKSLPFSKH